MNEPRGAHYTRVAIVLHWAIAAAILANLALGWWMHHAIEHKETVARAIAGYQLHKSLGLAVLVLTVLRLGWRLLHRAPPLPEAMPAWERRAARLVHWGLYALMVVVPLSGWTYVSAQWRGEAPLHVPTLWFGLFEVPHLFDAAALAADERKAIAARNAAAHVWLAWSMGGLLVLHAAAALKHRFVNRDGVMASMRPAIGAGIAAVVMLAIAVAMLATPGSASKEIAIRSAFGGWAIDPSSEIAFEGVEDGNPFRGRFTRWEAKLRFNPLASPVFTVAATVDMTSATDGVPLHEAALLEREWFDVARYPQARFVATRIEPKPGGGHTVEGALTIKDRIVPVPPLDLVVSEEGMRISGQFTIDRADANLGMESDPEGDYVSRRIGVEVRVLARAPGSS
ncbi:MAG: cytochrome b/b6 domain-containing protein [Gammaproteobacteria bacterium]